MSYALARREVAAFSGRMMDRFKAEDAATPVSVLSPTGASGAPASVFGHDPRSAEQLNHFRGWVFASVRPIAQTIAGLRVSVGVKQSAAPNKGRATKFGMPQFIKEMTSDVEVVENHPLADVFNNPNPLMVRWHLLYILAASLEMTGEHHWWLWHEDDKPTIWPVPSSWIQPVHTQGHAFARWRITPGGMHDSIEVPANEVIYFHYPSPANPLDHVSPMGAQSQAVVADEAIQTAQSQSFENGIWPGLAIIAGDIGQVADTETSGGRPLLEHEQRAQIHSMIRRHYAGVTKMKEALILDALIKDVKQITRGPSEMDFMDSSKATKARITQGVGTNPIIMGEIEGVNRASSAEARQHFADFTVNPKVEMISQVLTKAFIRVPFAGISGQTVVWIHPYQPADREERRKDIQVAAKVGAITRNEIRLLLSHLELNPLDGPGDDRPLTPTGGHWTVNEKRLIDGLPPIPGGDAVYLPASEIPALEFEQ